MIPLRAAIGCYIVGNYLGTIAICGTVCEMLAIVSFDLAMIRMGTARMDETTQKKVLGETFEKLGQDRRIHELRGMLIIDDNLERLLRLPLNIRKKYLHFFSEPHNNIAADARKAWQATRDTFLSVFKMRLKDEGKIVLDPVLSQYLRSSGRAGQSAAALEEN